MSTLPQFLASQKAALDQVIAIQTSFFNGFEKLVDLNLKVVRASLEELSQKSREAAELKDAQETLAFTSSLVQPGAEKAMAYGKHVYDILSSLQADLSKLSESQAAQVQKQIADAIEQFARTAPAGSEGAISLLKSSLATATNAYESVAKAAKQATDAAESNLTAAASATIKAATDAAEAVAVKPGTRTRRTDAA